MESVLVHCSAATLPRPRGRTRRRHTQVRARPLIGLLLIAACLLPLLDRKNQMVMDGMDNRVRSAIMPLCLAFSGREERTWLWPLGLGGSACAGGRWCRRPSPSLLCAMAPPRVSSLGDGNVHGSASTKGRGRE
jgi:hypothetical protein